MAVWVKATLAMNELDTIDVFGQELVWPNVKLSTGRPVAICAAYRPGTCSDTDTSIFNVICRGLTSTACRNSAVIVAGDFNVHNQEWLHSSRTTRAGEHAEDMCYMHSLEQLVDQPTRGRNTLDLIMSDLPVESWLLSCHLLANLTMPVYLLTSRFVHHASLPYQEQYGGTSMLIGPGSVTSSEPPNRQLLLGLIQTCHALASQRGSWRV